MSWKVVLASGSPRRKEILEQANVEFEMIDLVEVDETYPLDLNPFKVPLYLAKLKSKAYVKLIKDNFVLITADTVVILNDQILGKPSDRNEAIEMLNKLSGQRHCVVTAVVIRTVDKCVEFDEKTDVEFEKLTQDQIEYYVDQCNPYDKAGGYGIQDWIGVVGVKNIYGSFYNVMGLPIGKVYQEIIKITQI